ncbi:MAG: metalloregulator ArsR/SmtB family transcription factor, partial [Pseudomonadota bacterium]
QADMSEKAEEVAGLLGLMANRSRLLILCRLVEGPASVGALAEAIDLSQSALSQHLAKLRRADLVTTTRQGQFITYRLASKEAETLMRTLYDLYCAPPD